MLFDSVMCTYWGERERAPHLCSIAIFHDILYTSRKKFSEGKQAHVGMEALKTNQTDGNQ